MLAGPGPSDYGPRMLPAARFGVYVHFPYCLSKCPYCDFASQVEPELPHQRYADAIVRELELRAPLFAGRKVESLYFGGGTPSLWNADAVGRVVGALKATLPFADEVETTFEANPGAADVARFEAFHALGFRRLSMGVQSFDEGALAALGRRHTPADVERAFLAARDAGFENVSLDLLYGSHGHGPETAAADARRVVALGPDHVSAYALTLEAQAVEVPLAKQVREGTVSLPDEERTAAMGDAVRDVLRDAGYARYEISNFARDGKSSRHNALYWKGGEYLALGCGATGFRRTDSEGHSGSRYTTTRSAEGYMRALEEGRLPAQDEPLDAEALFTERLMLGLRLAEGIDLAATATAFGREPGPLLKQAQRLVLGGWGELEGTRLRLTDLGMDLHTEAAVRLL